MVHITVHTQPPSWPPSLHALSPPAIPGITICPVHIYITAWYPGHVISCLSCSRDLLTRLSALDVFPQSHTPHCNWSGLSQVTFQTLIVQGVRAFILFAPKTPMSFTVPSLTSLPSPTLYIPTLFSFSPSTPKTTRLISLRPGLIRLSHKLHPHVPSSGLYSPSLC